MMDMDNDGQRRLRRNWTCHFIFIGVVWAQPLPASAFADESSGAERAAGAVSAAIDALFEKAWAAAEVTPSEIAGDDEFLRRVYLDLAGRIPGVSEIRDFRDSTSTEKRQEIVRELLDSPAYVRNMTTVLRNALIPQASSQPEFRGVIPGFEAWLWKRVSENVSYDKIAREIITTDLNNSRGNALSSTTSPDAFFVVRELKPENLAAGTARAFLGVRLDCAQCHNHPFDSWSQKQFWSLAAFYGGFAAAGSADGDVPVGAAMEERTDVRSIAIPGTGDVVPAMYLNGVEPDWSKDGSGPRQRLAEWVVAKDNPYFADMAVNRMWAQFFGRGLVDPVDDFSVNNPASHPAVLQLLAEDFAANDFDLQRLVRIITGTRVYQRSSRQTHESQREPADFARAALRGLTPEQLFDSLAEATGYYQPYRSENPFVIDTNSPRGRFLDQFRDSAESPLDRETTILQALTMMNGRFVDEATSLEESRTLRSILEFPAMPTEQKVETLFLASVSRSPTAEEQTRLHALLDEDSDSSAEILSDIFWALLNSSEFLLNH
ncbi:MAG: DUF1553 domain-containing protein [Planctomycetaceae bacterium]|nr:DUF1553 domain-containing protein [Planctomycetaceae bacterium]